MPQARDVRGQELAVQDTSLVKQEERDVRLV